MTPSIFTACVSLPELTVPAVSFAAHLELMSCHPPAVCIFLQLLRLRVSMFTVHLPFFFFPAEEEGITVCEFFSFVALRSYYPLSNQIIK